MNPAPVGVLIKNAPVEGSTWYTVGDWHQSTILGHPCPLGEIAFSSQGSELIV